MKSLYKFSTIKHGEFNRERAESIYIRLSRVRYKFAEAINAGRATNLRRDGLLRALRDEVATLKESYKSELKNPLYVTVIQREDRGYIIQREIYGIQSRVEAIASIKEELREVRRERRTTHSKILNKSPNEVLRKLYKKRLKTAKFPKENDRTQYVGIEIECLTPTGADFSKLAEFHKYLAVGSDGSINCEGNTEGTEFRLLVTRDEVRTVVPSILKAIHGLGARVNKSCGLHVHLDQRHAENPALNYQKLVRAQSLLYAVVPASRRDNQYCKRTRNYDFADARNGRRYHAINPCAFDRYRTLEVRLFGGTLDADKIVNWIETLHGIVDGDVVLRCPKNFEAAKRHWKLSDENVAWLKARQEKFAELNNAPTAESDNAEPEPIPLPVTVSPEQQATPRPRTAREETLRRAYGAGRRAGSGVQFPSYSGSFVTVNDATSIFTSEGNGQLGRIEGVAFTESGATPETPPNSQAVIQPDPYAEFAAHHASQADTPLSVNRIRDAVEQLRNANAVYFDEHISSSLFRQAYENISEPTDDVRRYPVDPISVNPTDEEAPF